MSASDPVISILDPVQRTVGGQVVLLSQGDHLLFDQHAEDWRLRYSRGKLSGIIRTETLPRTPEGTHPKITIFLHRSLLGAGAGQWIAYRDGNPLNLQRENLELLSHRPNKAAPSCPFSPGRLEELYWEEKRPLMEIAELARIALGEDKAPSQRTVQQWFAAAGVSWTTRQQQGHRIQSKYDRAQATRKALETKAGRGMSEEGRAALVESGKRLHEEHKTKRLRGLRRVWREKHIALTCAHCGKSFERLGCHVRRRERRWREDNPDAEGECPHYCSHSCSSQALASERWREIRIQQLVASSGTGIPVGHEAAVCAQCGRRFTAPAADLAARRRERGDRLYCSHSCSNRVHARERYPTGPETIELVCVRCATVFVRSAAQWRGQLKRNPESRPHCSRACSIASTHEAKP